MCHLDSQGNIASNEPPGYRVFNLIVINRPAITHCPRAVRAANVLMRGKIRNSSTMGHELDNKASGSNHGKQTERNNGWASDFHEMPWIHVTANTAT
jgi:hypothetical protein